MDIKIFTTLKLLWSLMLSVLYMYPTIISLYICHGIMYSVAPTKDTAIIRLTIRNTLCVFTIFHIDTYL